MVNFNNETTQYNNCPSCITNLAFKYPFNSCFDLEKFNDSFVNLKTLKLAIRKNDNFQKSIFEISKLDLPSLEELNIRLYFRVEMEKIKLNLKNLKKLQIQGKVVHLDLTSCPKIKTLIFEQGSPAELSFAPKHSPIDYTSFQFYDQLDHMI